MSLKNPHQFTKSQFKSAYSIYREKLSNGDNQCAYVKAFNLIFGAKEDRVAFPDNGCSYSFPFAWIYGERGSFKAERIVNRNDHVLS